MWHRAFPGRNPAVLNPRGGAIALGHPFGGERGAPGRHAACAHLEATGGRYGFQTICEGGGQANALVLERLG